MLATLRTPTPEGQGPSTVSQRSQASERGASFLSMLTILFIALKLTGHINWSWWWVLSPLWIPPALFLCLAAVFLLFAGLCWLLVLVLESRERRKRAKGLAELRGKNG